MELPSNLWHQLDQCQAKSYALQAAAIDGNNEYALQFEWTSPLGGQPNIFHTLKGVTAEQTVVGVVTQSSVL